MNITKNSRRPRHYCGSSWLPPIAERPINRRLPILQLWICPRRFNKRQSVGCFIGIPYLSRVFWLFGATMNADTRLILIGLIALSITIGVVLGLEYALR